MIWLFFRASGNRILVAVAEVKNNECWIITTLAMVDLDQKGHVSGIEFVGQKDFSIRELLRDIPG